MVNFVASISLTGSDAAASLEAVTTSSEVDLSYVADIIVGVRKPTTATTEAGSSSAGPFQFSAAAML